MPRQRVRFLRPGESLPTGEPTRRFTNHRGYVVLEWKVGTLEYVRIYEHRARVWATLRPGEIVHHADGDRGHNPPGNLEPMTQVEHARAHHPGATVLTPETIARIRELRAGGMTQHAIASRIGCSKASVWNALRIPLALLLALSASLTGGAVASAHHDPSDPDNGILLVSEETVLELPCTHVTSCDPPESTTRNHSDPACPDPNNWYCLKEETR